jgi:hypothetical protein
MSSPPQKAFLGGITSPLGALVAPSPPSALNEIQQLAALYEETRDEAHLKRVREIVKYIKIAKKAVEGMDKKQRARHRASTNSKWLDDVPNIAIYGMFPRYRSICFATPFLCPRTLVFPLLS